MISWFIAIVGSLCMITSVSLVPDYVMGIFLLIVKFGVSSGNNQCYIGGATLFPAVYTGMAMGTPIIAANLITILAPEVASLNGMWPMILLCIMSTIAMFASMSFKKHDDPHRLTITE